LKNVNKNVNEKQCIKIQWPRCRLFNVWWDWTCYR